MSEVKPNLGEHELEVLRHIAAHPAITARDVVETVGAERSLARTTILTVIERLRKKGYLTRELHDNVYLYSAREPQNAVMQDLVRNFVEKMLGGTVSPIVAYLASVRKLPEEDLAEMQRLVEDLRAAGEEENASAGQGGEPRPDAPRTDSSRGRRP